MGLVITALLLVSAVPVVRFYQGYWQKLHALPVTVLHRERREGGHWVALNQVSPWLPKALIATEDRTFYSNLGISFEGIGRSLIVDIRTKQLAQGGSTLTQQLVRDTLLTPQKTFRRKVSEALLSLMMTVLYSKQEILTLYLNEVYLGDNAYGIDEASHRYFGVSPDQLTLAQAALIAGLPQAPSAYDPYVHFRAAKIRQWQVLQSMEQTHVISPATARRAYHSPLGLMHNPPAPRSV